MMEKELNWLQLQTGEYQTDNIENCYYMLWLENELKGLPRSNIDYKFTMQMRQLQNYGFCNNYTNAHSSIALNRVARR